MRGVLILVVGPSGAGKDSLIRLAQEHFAGDVAIAFARRCITRPGDAGGEAHDAMTPEAFERRLGAGGFMLAWQAHGLRYGIPGSYADDLASGRAIVANVSRTVVDEARRRFQPLTIVHVTAAPSILAQRLAARGREVDSDRETRLRRTVEVEPGSHDLVTIRNESEIGEAADRFIACLAAAIRVGREARAAP